MSMWLSKDLTKILRKS